MIGEEYLKNLDNIPLEYIKVGYNFVKEYCEKDNLEIKDFFQDKNKIVSISKVIRNELPFKYKLFLSENKLVELISENLDWIANKFEEFKKLEKSNSVQKKM